MDHISILFNYKKIVPKDILMSLCRITLKIDGNALQMAYDTKYKAFSFHKRSYSPLKLGQTVDEFDTFCYSCYRDGIERCVNGDYSVCKNYDIINFEIVDNSMNHLVKYDSNKMYVLSAYKDGRKQDISPIVDALDVEPVPVLFNGIFTEEFVDDILFYKDDMTFVWNAFCKLLNLNAEEYMEGIVLEFYADKKRTYKLVNPNFKHDIDEHLKSEKELKSEINLENVYDLIIKKGIIYRTKIVNYKDTYMSRLLYLCSLLDEDTKNKCKKMLENFNLSAFDTILIDENYAEKICPEISSFLTNDSINILKFVVLCFRNKRSEKCLWCSKEYQLKVNNFIDTLK